LAAFFGDELAQPGFGARKLVAKAFDGTSSMLGDSELPSIRETYVHLFISAFLLTLSLSQKDTFLTIISLLVPNAILVGQTGSSISTGATHLPTCHEDVKHFYTDNVTSILQKILAPVTKLPKKDGNIYSFSSYYDCTQHFLTWAPLLVDILEEISIENGPLCLRYQEIADTCSLLSPHYKPLVLLFDKWRDTFEGATLKNWGNVHANTMTFLGPPGSYTSPHYTFTVCIGSGSFNSITAEKEPSLELHSLTSKCIISILEVIRELFWYYWFHCHPFRIGQKDVTVPMSFHIRAH
jgi:hypothetical protein